MIGPLLLAANVWLAPVPVLPADAPRAVPAVPVGLDSWVRPDVWSVPVYRASASDPRHSLLYNPDAWRRVADGSWHRSGNSAEIEDWIRRSSSSRFPHRGNVYSSTSAVVWRLPDRFNGRSGPVPDPLRFHLSPSMRPAPGPDGHMAVVQPDASVLETYGTIRLSDGTAVALSYSVVDPGRSGDGFENGQTASMLPVHLGLLDADRLRDGRLDHALAITVPARLLAPAAVYPAFAFDRGALTETPRYAGSWPMGTRLALPPEDRPSSLRLATPEGAAIAEAARRHGFIVVDRGGEGISIRVRRNPARPNPRLVRYDAPLHDDLRRIFDRLVVVPADPTLPDRTTR